MAPRDRRAVLAVAGAAVVWRWLVGQATPLPGVDACRDLWCAAQLAQGHAGDLAARWWEAGWSLLLAPAVAAGLSAWTAARLLGALCGGLAVWFVATAAERQREGAGVPAAVLAMAAAGPTVAAAAGSATAWHALLVAIAVWLHGRGRHVGAAFAAALAVLGGGDQLGDGAGDGVVRVLRLAVGAAPLALLVLLPPRPRAVTVPAVGFVAVLAAAAGAARPLDWWPAWSPLAAWLAGIGLARVSTRWRELVLCAVVAAECHAAWHEIEVATAATERAVGRHLARRLPAGQVVLSDLPRVLWAAGARPEPTAPGDLAAAADWPDVGAVVLGPTAARSATLAAALARRFVAGGLPADLADLVAERGLRVLQRR